MHRQSLGSPASKLQCHEIISSGAGAIKSITDDNFITDGHRKDNLASSSAADDEEHKSQKSIQPKSVPVSSYSRRLVHLIPFLTLFCFLILYLFSHDPSTKDSIDVVDNADGGSKVIRNMRNLQQQERHRLHRKIQQ